MQYTTVDQDDGIWALKDNINAVHTIWYVIDISGYHVYNFISVGAYTCITTYVVILLLETLYLKFKVMRNCWLIHHSLGTSRRYQRDRYNLVCSSCPRTGRV